eukprot:3711641-Rhodomonas_salina.1
MNPRPSDPWHINARLWSNNRDPSPPTSQSSPFRPSALTPPDPQPSPSPCGSVLPHRSAPSTTIPDISTGHGVAFRRPIRLHATSVPDIECSI